MIFRNKMRGLAFAIALPAMMNIAPVSAQEVADSHLAKAREAIAAIKATDQFDQVLPASAFALKEQLIQKDPNLIDKISEVVDDETIKLATRRGDMEREAALAYARVFSEEELAAITEFYKSPVGQKLITDGPIATREMIKAGEIWQAGIARDLAEAVGKRLQDEVGAGGQPLQEEEQEKPAN